MKNKRVCAVIFGPQGSGKGTQALLMSERFGIPLIGSGDLFRAEMSEKTNLGKLVGKYVSEGLLAPDDLVNAVMARQLKDMDLSRGFILDGYPRNVDQATHLDKLININLAIQLKVDDNAVVKRLHGRWQCPKCRSTFHQTDAPPAKKGICSICGAKLIRRPDDTEEIIKQRLKVYHFMTAPLAQYYRQKGVLLVINAEQAIQYVFEDIVKKLSKLGFN